LLQSILLYVTPAAATCSGQACCLQLLLHAAVKPTTNKQLRTDHSPYTWHYFQVLLQHAVGDKVLAAWAEACNH
jgi:hypothetical protein